MKHWLNNYDAALNIYETLQQKPYILHPDFRRVGLDEVLAQRHQVAHQHGEGLTSRFPPFAKVLRGHMRPFV
jgi:hypothetical protein